ncbi:MAG: HlyD family efflux transporter periplasmic adaptor subunit [Pseudohongiellaceae bacterium]
MPTESSIPERSTLFRPEVLQYRLPARFGPAAGGTPVSLQLYAVLGLLFLGLLVLYLGVVRFKTTVSASGVLVPGDGAVRMGPSWQGVYQSIRVQEGEWVEAGEVMALISTRQHDAAGRDRTGIKQAFNRTEISQLQRKLTLVERSAELQLEQMESRRSQLRETAALLDDEAAIMQRRVAAARASLKARRTLRDRGVLADTVYRQHEESYLALVQKQQQLVTRQAANGQEQRELRERKDTIRLDQETQRHELESTIRRKQHESRLLDSDALLAVIAPASGVAGPVTARAGDVARPGSTLSTVIPADVPLRALLYLPGSAMGQVEAGQTVQLTYDAYPYQRYGNHQGRVDRVSSTTLDPREQRLMLPDIREPVYQLHASLPEQSLVADGESYRLRSGMRLRAEIVTAEMTLLAYMFDPLLRLLEKQELP